jgi:hypothetical protein
MNWKNKLLAIKLNNSKYSAEYIFKELTKSIKKGYNGKVFDFYISDDVGRILKSEGLEYKTYTDGEFSESSVWVND